MFRISKEKPAQLTRILAAFKFFFNRFLRSAYTKASPSRG
jgi:hypothetical protein